MAISGCRQVGAGAYFSTVEIMTGELRRLRSGPGAEDDEEPGLFLVRLRFAVEDPAQVIDKTRAVLTYEKLRMSARAGE